MKIAFFEIEDWEKDYLGGKLTGHQPLFFAGPLDPDGLEGFREAEALSPFIYSNISGPVLDRLPRLKLISTRSTGFEHIDLKGCASRGITVCNVPTYGENTVAEHTFALILSLSRNLSKAYIKRLVNDFSLEGLMGFDLKGKTLGVVGTGRIGLHVIRIAKSFGMNVLASDTRQNDLLAEVLGYAYVSLEELLRESHIVSLHVPYSERTHHLIDAGKFRLMRKGSLLINTARGAVVDTDALIVALEDGTLAGAGIDVLEGEECIREEKTVLCEYQRSGSLNEICKDALLLRKQNVVYTPHVAFNSREALERILETTVSNIECFSSGHPCNVVNGSLP